MKHFFVDYENVTESGLIGCARLKKEDRVTIFYSENAHKIDIRILKQLIAKAQVEFVEVAAGYKDALDHQLSSALGYMICDNRDAEYYIVSADNAFFAVVEYWRKRKIYARKIVQIAESLKNSAK